MITKSVEIPLQWARVQNVNLQQIVSSLGFIERDGLPYLRLIVLEESTLCPHRIVAYEPGDPINEDPGCYLGTMRIGRRKREAYLAE